MEKKKDRLNWTIAKSNSKLGFRVAHYVFAKVFGEFKEFSGKISSSDEDFTDTKIDLTIDVDSIKSGNWERNDSIKSAKLFAAKKYPIMHFISESLEKLGKNDYRLIGNLTIKNITNEIELIVTKATQSKKKSENSGLKFNITGSLNRFDYGLKYNKLLESGNLIVGEKVDLLIDVQLIRKVV